MVSKRDRRDYEEGKRDSKLGVLDGFITDLLGNHPDTDSYYKARRGERLDGDKKKNRVK